MSAPGARRAVDESVRSNMQVIGRDLQLLGREVEAAAVLGDPGRVVRARSVLAEMLVELAFEADRLQGRAP